MLRVDVIQKEWVQRKQSRTAADSFSVFSVLLSGCVELSVLV